MYANVQTNVACSDPETFSIRAVVESGPVASEASALTSSSDNWNK